MKFDNSLHYKLPEVEHHSSEKEQVVKNIWRPMVNTDK